MLTPSNGACQLPADNNGKNLALPRVPQSMDESTRPRSRLLWLWLHRTHRFASDEDQRQPRLPVMKTRWSISITLRLLTLAVAPAQLAAFAPAQAQAPVPVNLYVADLAYKGGSIQVGLPRKLTGDRGVSSQPSFTPDGKAILFVSRRDSGDSQSDIYRIDLATGAESRITATAEMENSPTVTPDGHLMVIRWTPATLFREWGPWIYDMSGRPLRGVLPGADTVGYYVRVDRNRFAMVRPKSRTAVAIFDSRTGSMKDYDIPVANLPPQLIRGEAAISYTRTDSAGLNQIRRLDLRTLGTSRIAAALPGRVAHTWASNGFVLMGKGNSVFALRPRSTGNWRRVASFADPELQSITTYVVSPRGDKLVLISPVKPALHAALRDSLQAKAPLGRALRGYSAIASSNLLAGYEVSEPPLVGLAAEQTARGQAADAISLLALISSSFPSSYAAHLALGDAHRKLGDEARAIAAWRRSIELNPQVTVAEKRDAVRAEVLLSNPKTK